MSVRLLALLAEGPLTRRSICDIVEITPPMCPEEAMRGRLRFHLGKLRRAGLISRRKVCSKEALRSRMIYSITPEGLAELENRTPEPA